MKAKVLNSITAKLFFLTSFLVLVTVGLNSYQNGSTFKQFLDHQFRDSTILQAKEASRSISGVIDSWSSQIALIMHSAQGLDQSRLLAKAQELLASNKDYVAFQIIEQKNNALNRLVFSETTNLDSPLFEDKNPKNVLSIIKKKTIPMLSKKSKNENSGTVLLFNHSGQTSLPIMSVAMAFSRSGATDRLWAVLTTWQGRISNYLPHNNVVESFVIDNSKRVFFATSFNLVKSGKNLGFLEIVKTAYDGDSSVGFLGGYKDGSDKEWLGAFVKMPKYKMTVIVQHDADSVYMAIRKIVIRTALWGILFILIAILLSYAAAGSLTRNLREVTAATKRIAGGDFSSVIKLHSRDEVGILSESVNQMATQIKELLALKVEQARFEKELETARMVQSTFFPKKQDWQGEFLNVAGFYQPASECGGDWWGHFISDEGVEYLMIADAMGHGVPAALVTAMAYASCMTISDILKNKHLHQDSPAKILTRFNKVLYQAVEGKISMTFFIAVFNKHEGIMKYANAGHNFPFLIPQDPDDHRIKRKIKLFAKISNLTPISLNLRGMPLGLNPDTEISEETTRIKPGDKFFFFTDGLIECLNQEGKAMGRKSLVEKVLKVADQAPAEIKQQITNSALEFFEGVPIKDDITMVCVEINKNISLQPKSDEEYAKADDSVIIDLSA